MRYLLVFSMFVSCLQAQVQPSQPDASTIRQQLRKLNFLGSVLYVAAHPDDENTRVIAYLGNEKLAAMAYLSMTRGDGGQNLIGPEIRDLLGLIRTQELLAARRIDGGQQFFTRANDFGFSKNVTETFETWGKEEILSDVIRVYRQYQPDVVITRFPPDERAGHGHHTASAVLAEEAFELASTDIFPNQVKLYGTWKPTRILNNTATWWNRDLNEHSPGIIAVNVGLYNSLLGKSYSEMAAESRTQHKSQGFGSPGRRGDAFDLFQMVGGDPASKDLFEGINVSWSRLTGGNKVEPLVNRAIREFDDNQPDKIVPLLFQIRHAITNLDESVWKNRKLYDVNQLIQSCLGLYAEVTTNQFNVAPGEMVGMSFELVNRSSTKVALEKISSGALSFDSVTNTDLGLNKLISFRSKKFISSSESYSSPYWLRKEHSLGRFTVSKPEMIGRPENGPAATVKMVFAIGTEKLIVDCPLIYKWTDPVRGELTRPFEIVPAISVGLTSSVFVFGTPTAQQVSVQLKSYSNNPARGTVKIEVPEGWRTEPASVEFDLANRGMEKSVAFLVVPPVRASVGKLKAIATIGDQQFDQSVQTISYDHIPIQTLMPLAEAKAVRIDLQTTPAVVGYVKGAGDEIPNALRNMGYQVWEMKDEEITAENLSKVNTVVLGIRALNTNDRIRYVMPALLSFVEKGGTMIVQYNNNGGLNADQFSPYPLSVSRDRITEENSEIKILKPDNALLTVPNKITDRDFEGWVQERGLYFPDKWDAHYEALLSGHDKGEGPKDGGLLVTKYGSGHYVYTSLAFFRQLPEGVPGAYRMFSNLVSLGMTTQPSQQKVKPSRK